MIILGHIIQIGYSAVLLWIGASICAYNWCTRRSEGDPQDEGLLPDGRPPASTVGRWRDVA
ncbi:hypothetical protein ACFXG4_04765 [Nocardia sp. NPDC059246]|uniref:hypothetical protein n=1 Tax=unclassified Nocardia TaxID=2637762 RepID=UPI0036BBA85D